MIVEHLKDQDGNYIIPIEVYCEIQLLNNKVTELTRVMLCLENITEIKIIHPKSFDKIQIPLKRLIKYREYAVAYVDGIDTLLISKQTT